MQKASCIAKPVRREWYLDNLKVFLTMLVILHHAGQAYGGSWPYRPSLDEHVAWLNNFFFVNSMFLMGLFFLISGYFLPGSYDRHGFRRYLGSKFLRLGIPLIVGVGCCSLVLGRIEFAQYWFIAHLLLFSLVYALFRLIRPKPVAVPMRFSMVLVLAAAGILAVVNYFAGAPFPPQWRFIGGFLWGETTHLPQYILLFVLGMAVWRGGWFDRIGLTTGYVLIGLGTVLAMIGYFRYCIPSLALFIDANMWWYDPLSGIFLCFGLVALFRFRFTGTSKLLQWLAAQSYGAFLLHIFVITGLQILFDRVPMGGGVGKFLFIGMGGIFISYGAAYLLRRIPGVTRVV